MTDWSVLCCFRMSSCKSVSRCHKRVQLSEDQLWDARRCFSESVLFLHKQRREEYKSQFIMWAGSHWCWSAQMGICKITWITQHLLLLHNRCARPIHIIIWFWSCHSDSSRWAISLLFFCIRNCYCSVFTNHGLFYFKWIDLRNPSSVSDDNDTPIGHFWTGWILFVNFK